MAPDMPVTAGIVSTGAWAEQPERKRPAKAVKLRRQEMPERSMGNPSGTAACAR